MSTSTKGWKPAFSGLKPRTPDKAIVQFMEKVNYKTNFCNNPTCVKKEEAEKEGTRM
ncbi:MAG: hypothetical protein V8S14_03485 [Lachnospiraceae bacterium]